MPKDEFEQLEDRITFAQAELPLGHPLSMLYRFHSAAVSSSEEFNQTYRAHGESEIEALRIYAADLENAVKGLAN